MLNGFISPPAETQEGEWVQGSEYLLQQLLQTLSEEVQVVCTNRLDHSLEQQLMQTIQEVIHQTSARMAMAVQGWAGAMTEQRNKLRECEDELRTKEDCLSGTQETIAALSSRITVWEGEYEALRVEQTETTERYERRLREARREKKEIKQTFRMVQENTEVEHALLQDLQLEKQEYHQLVITEQREKQELRGELDQLRQKYLESSRRLEASAYKLSWEEKRIAHLEDIVAQKDALIIRLRHEALLGNAEAECERSKSSFAITKSFLEERPLEEPKKYVSFAEIFKLSDEILNMPEEFEVISRKSALSFKRSDDLQLNKSLSQISEADPDIPITYTELPHPPPPPPPSHPHTKMPDFYLAHFLLTSQAMKIKLNCEEYLGIDLLPHYKDVVREGVPFHMWDDWIRRKLTQLAKR